jgi:histone H3/H4
MAAKKKAAGKKAAGSDAMIISKSRVKAAAKRSNVGSEFYGALEQHVRQVIASAEARAAANGRKTLRPQDV